MHPQIRALQFAELGQLRTLAFQSFDHTFRVFNTPENMDYYYQTYYSLEQLDRDFYEPGAVCYLAWMGEVPVGFVRLRCSDEVKNILGDNTLEIQRLYVHPDHQGHHIGSLLMQNALHYAKDKRVQWVWLGVWEHNTKAQQFYQKCGFERFGEHVFLMGDDPQTDWLLKREILYT